MKQRHLAHPRAGQLDLMLPVIITQPRTVAQGCRHVGTMRGPQVHFLTIPHDQKAEAW